MTLDDLRAFVHDEQQAAKAQLLRIWELPLKEKLRTGWSQDFTRLERGPEEGTLWAYPGDAESRYREGDLLCLHTGDEPAELLAEKLVFELEEGECWLLRGKGVPLLFGRYAGGVCYGGPDAMDLTSYYEQALDEIGKSAIGKELVLPLLSGEAVLTIDESAQAAATAAALEQGFNRQQADAVGTAVGAEQIACIQGPPGTGKTRVLALIARLLTERGERLLMTSHTHMAINNALNKIYAEGVATVKVGRRTQWRGLDDEVVRVEGLDDWRERPTNGYVVGATPFATCTDRLQHYEFDTILFDEASQVTIPLALMAMRKGRRFIFIGDEKQLPPVLLSRSVLAPEGFSIFARLTSPAEDHTVMLEETYRMSERLTAWPSRTYYRNRLRATGRNRSLQLQLTYCPPHLAAIFDPAKSAVFVPTVDRTARSRNRWEAERVAELCGAAVAGGLPLEEIGIVTPYRAQGRAIRGLLKRRFGAAANRVVADTVERMQGQERELVILSLATGDAGFLAAVAEFFFQPQRLNVSITRARSKLIIFGPEEVEEGAIAEPLLRDWIGQYRDLIAHCHLERL